MAEKMICGGWEIEKMEACTLPKEVNKAFSEALGDLLGATYTPALYAAHQLVAGMNYMIICKQTLMTAYQDEHVVQVVIHQPLEGKAQIMEIKTIL